MKVVKNILKWLLCVFLTFTTIFTINIMCDGGLEKVEFSLFYQKYEQQLKENADEAARNYEEMMNVFFNNREVSEEDTNFLREQYNKYPSGTTYLMYTWAETMNLGRAVINSAILGIILGTAIFLLIDSKDKKGIKIVIVLYILSIIILGFLQGFTQITGENLSVVDYFVFPDEYIIPATVAFGLVILIRIIKQKDMASKLNAKLKENK